MPPVEKAERAGENETRPTTREMRRRETERSGQECKEQ